MVVGFVRGGLFITFIYLFFYLIFFLLVFFFIVFFIFPWYCLFDLFVIFEYFDTVKMLKNNLLSIVYYLSFLIFFNQVKLMIQLR